MENKSKMNFLNVLSEKSSKKDVKIEENQNKNREYSSIGIICTIGLSLYDSKQKIHDIELNERIKNKWHPLISIALQIRGREIRTGLIDK